MPGRELIERRREESISPVENEELEEYLRLEHLMIMAKARAQLRVKSSVRLWVTRSPAP